MASRIQLQDALQKNYNRILFAKEVLNPVFGSNFNLFSQPSLVVEKPNETEQKVINDVIVYGIISLKGGSQINCYEITLQQSVHIQYSKVAIQRYVRKLLTSDQAALVNFISPSYPSSWRLTLVAKDSILTENGVKDKITHPKRYTFLLGTAETCKTAAERFEALSFEKEITSGSLVKAFSVERLSKVFFDEYKIHYERFINYIEQSNFKLSAFNNNEKAIRDYAKKLLGRLVFLYFVQKKGWLGASDLNYTDGDPDFLMSLFKTSGGDESFYSCWLSILFFNTLNSKRVDDNFTLPSGKTVKIPFLNGGLFDMDDYDDSFYTFDPILFHNPDNNDDPKFRGFFDFLGAFNFTVYEDSPEEHTIAVDPEMLGHIFENLLEDNKDKGAFYTPKEVVHYMCQESLIEYLSTHLSKEFTLYKQLDNRFPEILDNKLQNSHAPNVEKLGDNAINHEHVELIVMEKDINGLTHQQLKRIDSLLDSVKICDIAIGSGAYPMGLLQEIFSIKELIAYELGENWESAKVKENIIQNSIYGVDIEKGAVDIARLRFWLSLVVDEKIPKPLPNLDYKIVVGDSLVAKFESDVIEIDWSINDTKDGLFGQPLLQNKISLLKQISDKQNQYFHPDNKTKKHLATEIRNLKIDLLINQFELMVTTNGNDSKPTGLGKKAKEQTELYLQTQGWKQTIIKLQDLKKHTDEYFNHFDWKLDFPEILNPFLVSTDLGFDIVIGNPPYIQIQKLGEYANILEKAGYETFIRTGDIYGLFYELGTKLLKENGILTFITSNKWMRAGYGVTLRKFFTEKTNPLKLVDFGGFQVFETATVDTNILFLQKAKNQHKIETCVLNKSYNRRTNLSVYFRQNKTISTNFSAESGWVVLSDIENSIKAKIEKIGVPLKDWDIQINYGIKTGFNEAFIIDGKTKDELIEKSPKSAEIIRPILRGRDIRKYGILEQKEFLILIPNGWTNRNRGTEVPENYFKQRYVAVYDHFIEKSKLTSKGKGLFNRNDQGDYWWELRPCDYLNEFKKEKILYIDIMTDNEEEGYSFPCFSYTTEESYSLNTSYFMVGNEFNLKYILGVLNSKVGKFIVKSHVTPLQRRQYRLFYQFVENFQIPKISKEEMRKIIVLVDAILAKKTSGEDTTNLEDQINRLAYSYINLSKEEIEYLNIK